MNSTSTLLRYDDKSNIPLPRKKYFPVPGKQEELTDLHFTEVHVLKSLKTDNVQGPDNISAKLLATTADLLARPVYMIFKKSLQESILSCRSTGRLQCLQVTKAGLFDMALKNLGFF